MKESLTAWWCEPAIDFSVSRPQTFGRSLPSDSALSIKIEEAVFFAPSAVFRVARTKKGWQQVLMKECDAKTSEAKEVTVLTIPASLHRDTTRFTANLEERGSLLIKEWRHQGQTEAFTLIEGSK